MNAPWECPRCQTIHAPFVASCGCQPPTAWLPSEVVTDPGASVPSGPSPVASATLAQPPDKAEEAPTAPAASQPPSLGEAETAVCEVIGYVRHGRRSGGQMQHAQVGHIVTAMPHLSQKVQGQVLTRLSTAKWIGIRDHIQPLIDEKLLEMVDAHHFEYGSEKGGGLMGSLPTGDPRDAAKITVAQLAPVYAVEKRVDLDPAAALGMVLPPEDS